jgi:hypothetical protein
MNTDLHRINKKQQYKFESEKSVKLVPKVSVAKKEKKQMSKEKVQIFDTTLRDGEQAAGTRLGAREKVEIARQLVRLNVDIIEAGFPASSPEDFEAVRLISEQIQGPVICGLTYGKTMGEKQATILKMAVEAVRHTAQYVKDIEFYAEDSGRAERAFLYEILEAVIDAGATVVNIPDTTWYSYPRHSSQCAEYCQGDNQRALPRRFGNGCSEFAGRRKERRTPGGRDHQRCR